MLLYSFDIFIGMFCHVKRVFLEKNDLLKNYRYAVITSLRSVS